MLVSIVPTATPTPTSEVPRARVGCDCLVVGRGGMAGVAVTFDTVHANLGPSAVPRSHRAVLVWCMARDSGYVRCSEIAPGVSIGSRV